MIGGAQLVCRDVRGHLDDAAGLAVGPEHGVVAGLDPDLLATLAEALVLACVELAGPQALPEGAVLGRVAVAGLHEQAVVLALDLVESVAQRGAEGLVGVEDHALQVEGDHGLRFRQRVQLGAHAGGGGLQRGGLGPVLRHLVVGRGVLALHGQAPGFERLGVDAGGPRELLGLQRRVWAPVGGGVHRVVGPVSQLFVVAGQEEVEGAHDVLRVRRK